MENLIQAKVAGSNYNFWDFLAIGVSKRTTEAILAKTPVGNGTLKSAAIKVLGGIAISQYVKPSGMMGKLSDYVAAGLIVDGVEDLTVAVLGTGNPIDAITGMATGGQAQVANSVEVI